jgi:hypothetical protein
VGSFGFGATKKLDSWLISVAVVFFLVFPVSAAVTQNAEPAEQVMIVKQQTRENDVRYDYYTVLLRAILEETRPSHGPYKWQPFPDFRSTHRQTQLLADGQMINILHSSNTEELDQVAVPVPLHVRKGLNGMRLLLIRKEDAPKFAELTTLEGLKGFVAGQGKNWPDVAMYKANELPILDEAEFDSLLGMLAAGRFDYYPLGISEAPRVLQECGRRCDGLMIEPTLYIHYPFPVFFYVTKSETKLLERITTGMRRLVSNGTFAEIWDEHHYEDINDANLEARRRILLPNKFIPGFVDMSSLDLWLVPPVLVQH